jgi:hypothetical protein
VDASAGVSGAADATGVETFETVMPNVVAGVARPYGRPSWAPARMLDGLRHGALAATNGLVRRGPHPA